MSFSDELKLELICEEPPRKGCCRRAFALGLLFCADMTGGVFRLDVSGGAVGEEIVSFLSKQLHTEVQSRPFSRVGRPYLSLMLVSRGIMAQLQKADMSDLPLPTLLGLDCENCLRYFLRGVFVAYASVTDPAKSYHMEITCHSGGAAKQLASVLAEVATEPKVLRRATGPNLYYRKSAAVEDVLSYLHAHRALFAIINQKIERDIRNEENRATNCVAKNIQKAVDAAAAQIAAIERLRASREWDKLSEPLRETAELRLANEEASLAELAAAHEPPITKSGLNNRLKKLLELAKEIEH